MRLIWAMYVFLPLFTSFSNEFEITNRDVGLTIPIGDTDLELMISAGILFDFESGDDFTLPFTFEADFQWLQLAKEAFSLGFQSGLFTILGLEKRYGDLDGVIDDYGINILRLEPEVRITDKTAVFLNLIIANYDFEDFDFLIGTFGPQSEIGLKIKF